MPTALANLSQRSWRIITDPRYVEASLLLSVCGKVPSSLRRLQAACRGPVYESLLADVQTGLYTTQYQALSDLCVWPPVA